MNRTAPKIGDVLTGTYHGVEVIGRLTETWRGALGGAFYVVTLDGAVPHPVGGTITECLLTRDELAAWTVVDAVAAPTRATANGRVIAL